MEDPEKNREWGKLLHLILSMINHSAQIDMVLQELLVKGIISSMQQSELKALLSVIMKDPEISRFFDPEYSVRNEPEILSAEGHLYRPDRLLMKNDHVTIIDYKTGKHREEHSAQIHRYADLIKGMKYEVDGAYLLYFNRQPEVIKVI
jgi:CRISPR/Cas system-associated exonuclease Cas4 (RecB family)